MPLDLWKSIAVWDVPRLRPFVLLVRATCRWRSKEWHLTRESRSNVEKKSLSQCHFFQHNSTPRSPAINRLDQGIAPVKTKIKHESYLKIGSSELNLKIHFVPCSKKKTLFRLKNLIRHCLKETKCFYIVHSVHYEILKQVSLTNAQLQSLWSQNKCMFVCSMYCCMF